jgi:TolA-binding protein
MKYMLPLLWAFCLLCFSCKSIPPAGPEVEVGGPAEMPAAPSEKKEPSGLEAAGEDEIPPVILAPENTAGQERLSDAEPEFAGDSTPDLPEEEEMPELTLFEPFPPDVFPESPDEFAALPEPAFPEPEAEPEAVTVAPEIVAVPPPESRPQLPEPLMMDEPPVLDIIREPAPEPARPELARVPPAAPENPPVPAARPLASAPPESPARPRPAEPVSGLTREPLSLPVAPVPSLPARDPPAPPAIPPLDGEIEYSRIVRAAVGQTIEIPFRGTGWVYLGELRSRPGVAYNSRRSDPEGQTFVFRSEEAGTFGLKFYKQDYIRDYILNDYVQVIVGEAPGREPFAFPGDRGQVISAPRWPYLPGEEPSAGTSAGTSAVSAQTEGGRTGDVPAGISAGPSAVSGGSSGGAAVPQTPPLRPPETPQPAAERPLAGRPPPVRTEGRDDDSIVPVAPPQAVSPVAAGEQPPLSGDPSLPDDTRPEEYFRRAGEAFEAGQIQPALALLDRFQERYPLGSDEAWWLYGQLLEAAGPSRDIRLALDYYRRLVREYPQSPRYNDARRRIAYLERFYFNIR